MTSLYDQQHRLCDHVLEWCLHDALVSVCRGVMRLQAVRLLELRRHLWNVCIDRDQGHHLVGEGCAQCRASCEHGTVRLQAVRLMEQRRHR